MRLRYSIRVVILITLLIVILTPAVVRADTHYNYELSVGFLSHRHVQWTLDAGDGVYGDFEVTYPASGADQIITFFICDQDDYDDWAGGGSPSVYHLQENADSYNFKFRIPYDDTWHFVFKNYAFLTTKTVQFDLYRDTTPPDIDMNLDAGATYSGIKEITATITEATFSISQVKLYIDGYLKDTEYDSWFSYSWDTTQYSNGAHTVKIWASDNVGNSDYEEVTVQISNVVPGTTTGGRTSTDGQIDQTTSLGILLFLGVLGIAVVAAAVILSRREKGLPPARTVPSIPPTPPPKIDRPRYREPAPLVLIVCPYCGARNEQGIINCRKCGAEI